ncbi:MAG TPA: hyalin [Planctomycetaceae bacterium]|nr:hyalin [Planctomycetaceae bacterium]
MEIDQLRNFLKVAEHGNFTRAAEDVGLSQPALSRSIGRLEEELGQPVFDRQSRCVALNDAGQRLLVRARQILLLVDEASSEICDDGRTGRIRIGAIPTIAPYLLPRLLRTCRDGFPEASIIVQEDTTEALLKSLAAGTLDIAILALPIAFKYLEVIELFEEELWLVLPADHPLVKRKTIRMSDIASLPFVMLGEAHCLAGQIRSFCRQKSFHPLAVEQTSQLATVQELVSLGHGISLVPDMAKQIDTSDRRVYRALSDPKPTRKIAALFNPYRFQSKLMKAFLEKIREECRQSEA